MRQKVVTVSDKSRTSNEKCRKNKRKINVGQSLHTYKLHTEREGEERERESEKAMAGATTEKRRAAMQKAKAMPKQDKT